MSSQRISKRRKINAEIKLRRAQSQPTPGSSNKQVIAVESEDESYDEDDGDPVDKDLVKKAIRFILQKCDTKLPIKHADIIKYSFPGKGRNAVKIMKHVRKTLLEIYGYQLEPVQMGKKTQHYIIINNLKHHSPCDVNEKNIMNSFILLVLTFVFMKNETSNLKDLYAFLRQLGIKKNQTVIGDIENFITNTMVKQHYLVIKENVGPGEPSLEWGERAELEFSKQHILQFVSNTLDGIPLTSWKDHLPIVEKQHAMWQNEGYGDRIENKEVGNEEIL